MPYRLTEIALEDLRQIYAYSADRWGADRARAYIQTIYNKLESLAGQPDRDISRRARSQPFQMIATGNHFVIYETRLIYETKTELVIVHAIPHQNQDVERHIAKLTPMFRKAVADITRRT